MIPTNTAWQIVDHSSDPVLVFDALSYALLHGNPAALSIAETSRAAGVELADLPSWLNLSDEQARTQLSPDALEQREHLNFEATHHNAFFDVNVLHLSTAETPDTICLQFRDITPRREAERVKEELVSTVSHELRSPLTAIKGAMGLVLAGSAGEIPQRVHDMIQIAHRNSDRLILIINDILDLDKIADGTMAFDNSEVEISDVIHIAVEGIAGFSERFDVSILVEIDTSSAVSFIDPNRLVQVLVNLLSNAIKFSPAGGSVTVGLTQHLGYNRLSVADAGEGIPAAQLESLFQRFVQIGAKNRAATGGTGLGLSIVKAILEQQGGKISVESAVGRGTTFFVDIPIHVAIGYPEKLMNGMTS